MTLAAIREDLRPGKALTKSGIGSGKGNRLIVGCHDGELLLSVSSENGVEGSDDATNGFSCSGLPQDSSGQEICCPSMSSLTGNR